MTNIIKAELYKIFKYKITYVVICLLGIAEILGIFVNVGLKVMRKSSTGGVQLEIDGMQGYINYFNGNITCMLMAIIVISIIAAEYQTGGIRQKVCRGYTRASLEIGQFVAFFIVIFSMFFTFAIIDGLISVLFWSVNDISLTNTLGVVLGDLCITAVYVSLGLFFVYITRRSGMAIMFLALLIFGGDIAVSILSVFIRKFDLSHFWLSGIREAAIGSEESVIGKMLLADGILLVIAVVLLGVALTYFKRKDIE